MNHRRLSFHFERPTVGTLELTYEFSISRTKYRTEDGRTTYEPHYTHGLLNALLVTPTDAEYDWSFQNSKEEMHALIKQAIKSFDFEIYAAIDTRVRDIVNSSTYEDNPHASDPPDPS